ncbi:MAG: pentapeptide repeat-containing protein [Paenisporosarcina sp.]|nr:pentapeptide repeat-containing protein [Paenisporosarcina sp.]
MKLDKPKLPKELNELDVSNLLEEDRYISRGIIRSFGINELPEGKVTFDQIHFQDVSFGGIQFEQVEFIDCRFDRCDLSNVNLSDAIIHRVEISQSKLVGMQCPSSRLGHMLIHDCVANYASFSFSQFKNVRFQQTSLSKSDFFESGFTKVEFDTCELDGANFSETSLTNIDLSTCTYEQVTVSVDKLVGCTVSTEQALGFAKSLGLVIKD